MSDVRDVLFEAAAELAAADAILEHGRRAVYQAGCRCRCCSVANADYQARYRAKVARGKPLLGVVVSGHFTAQRIRSLQADGFSLRAIARTLHLDRLTVRRHVVSAPARVRTVVKVGRFWRDQQVAEE